MNTDNTLVTGLAAGYHYGDVRPFVASLRETGFAGRCVLFVSPTTRDLERIAEHGVECICIDREQDFPELAHLPWNALRFFIYRHFLRTQQEPFERILISDVRDVVFQLQPFSIPWPAELSVALEDQRMTVGTCPYMKQWSCGHLGKDNWQRMARHSISCSGTSIAGHDAMLDYLERMCGALVPFTPGKGMAGYDQAVHNHLLRTGALPHASCTDNRGPILTLGYHPGIPAMDAAGRYLNDAGNPAMLVHQYDRKPDLFAALRRRYAPAKRT